MVSRQYRQEPEVLRLDTYLYLATFRRQAADVLSQDGRGPEASTPLAATARSVSLPKLNPGGGGSAIASVRTDTSKLKRSKAAEARAWKELAGMRQAVQKARAQAAQRDLHERRAAGRVAYDTHAFGDRMTSTSVAAASAAEFNELSEQFNTQIAFLETDPAKRSWFKLFKFMDSDGSGRVTYEEVRDMVRSEEGGLRLGEDKLPDARLQSLWRALDDDASGYITVKECMLHSPRTPDQRTPERSATHTRKPSRP